MAEEDAKAKGESVTKCATPVKTREDPPFYTQTELLLRMENKQKLIDFKMR